MTALTRENLYSLEKYAAIRPEFRSRVMAHKKHRQVQIGPNATLYFEDELTMQYQVQEMLRIEKIFEADGINEELETYNALIPEGNNWKATFMLEYKDADERKIALGKLLGIEKRVWVKIDDSDPVYPIANEDLERETEEKTSAVHFLRFELSAEMLAKAKANATISMGIDHPEYNYQVQQLDNNTSASLVNDLD